MSENQENQPTEEVVQNPPQDLTVQEPAQVENEEQKQEEYQQVVEGENQQADGGEEEIKEKTEQEIVENAEENKDKEQEAQEQIQEEEIEEDIPAEELDELKKKAVEDGQDPETVPTKRMVKKPIQKEEANEEEQDDQAEKPVVSGSNVDRIVDWMCKVLEKEMPIYEEQYWNDAIDEAAKLFITDKQRSKLFLWVEEEGMKFSFTDPPKLSAESYDTDFQYFVKVDGLPLDIDVIESQVQHSSVKPNHITTLLKLLDDIYNPQIYLDQSWPENVKKEFISQLHRNMATLTEISQQQEGFTKLYIPKEDLTDIVQASQDKDLISRLEPTLIQWYRQIKDIVNNQDGQPESEYAGPLEEISFWSKRKENLAQLQAQLENPDLQKIIKILQMVASSYVDSFQETTKNINTGTAEAENNLAYLNSLYKPCIQLERSSPKEIPSILPGLLNRVRMISEYSQQYNSPERIIGLLQKISNEIIKRCKATIKISDMLDGDVEKCMEDLQDSIQCGTQWRQIYQKTSEVIKKKNQGKKWDFNMNSIFAQIDAFVQRCTELKEICEGQLQFAQKGKDSQIPKFGGSRGVEIDNILTEIKLSFKKQLDKIRDSEQDKILDVKASNWHELFNSFKTGLKDLDVIYINIINQAFEQVSTVQQGVQMLEAFDYLAKRPTIKDAVKKKANEIIQFFISEVDKCKQEYDTKLKTVNLLNIPLHHGKISGSAIWVRCLMGRISKMKDWVDKLYFIDDDMKKAAYEKYEHTYQAFRLCIIQTKTNEWKQENKELDEAHEKGIPLHQRLERAVLFRPEDGHNEQYNKKELVQLRSKPGYIECNFDKQLEKLMHEAMSWKKLATMGAVIPNYMDEFTTTQKENLRVLKEYVLLVVRDQNKIKDFMDPQDQKLFKGHMDLVDNQIKPSLSKLKWSTKGILDKFVFESRKVCSEMYNKLKTFKQNTEKIEQKCLEISQKIFVKLDKKKAVEIEKFERDQKDHREFILKQLKAAFEEIRRILCETYEPFITQGKDIQTVWRQYVLSIDKKIEEALKRAVKNSLIEIQKVVGDEDTNQTHSQLIKLYVELENSSIIFKPSTETLIQVIRTTMASMTELLRDFKRMEVVMYEERKVRLEEFKILREKELKANPHLQRKIVDFNMNMEEPQQKESYFEGKIASDHDVKKFSHKTLENLQKQCIELEKGSCKDAWNHTQFYWGNPQNKDKFVESLIKTQDDIQSVQTFISKLQEEQFQTQKEKTTDKQGCISLDNSNVKSAIIDILMQYQTSMLNAVHKRALKSLNELYEYFNTNELNLKPQPLDLKQLKTHMDILKKCNDERQRIEDSIKPIEEKFALLANSYVTLKEEDIIRQQQIRQAWAEFKEMLEFIEQRNTKVRQELYNETQRNLDEFVKDASDNKVHFSANAPFQLANLSNEKAFSLLNEYKDLTKQLRKKETQMKFGYELFEIVYASPPELDQVELEIERLESVWKTKNEWDNQWEETKLIKFKDFDHEALDDLADEYQLKLNSYPKEMKKWEIVNSVKQTIESFRQTLPLIKMLQEPYMRQRHWNQLQDKIGNVLDYTSDSFTLQEIFKIDILKYHDSVRDVCDIAREEFKIESALAGIRAKWDMLEVVADEHKKGMYKIKKVDDVFSTLEDHMSVLSAQKTTLFYESFRDEIEHWENLLQYISESLEMILQVQRKWIYLEAIFNSQQGQDNDQKKQLMGDINQFEKTEKKFQKTMAEIYKDPNAKRQLGREGLFKELEEMSKELDKSQKILNQLLDRNRKDFPRFFFLSNDDLFEILGNSKDPSKINKHIKKCFEGIKKLQFEPNQTITGAKGKAVENYNVVSMFSAEGENVKLTPPVQCDYGVEKWLNKVEFSMQESLKKLLFNCQNLMKTKEGWRWVEKWVQAWPGQLLIVASQIAWTKDCQDALKQIEDKPEKSRAWKVVKDQKAHFITELTKLVRKPGSEVDRLKLIAMITIEVHAKDIIEALSKSCFSSNSFDWLKQLRFVGKPVGGEQTDVTIYQTNRDYEFKYGFEYQGNNGRLVITALTDRCYMTLTTAMRLNKGGSPQGPAGTGKTESVKDLGKGMGKFVLVFNCSEGLDYKSIGRMFSGLVQTGGWGCFDEFNRIEVEVLSVVAQQMHQIMNAKRRYRDDPEQNAFAFDEEVIPLNDSMAIFITMNPGYAGRSELPDNLKSLFRPISMMIPETSVICEIMLQSEGFKNGRALSLKIVTLYTLMTQQLSKQDHYDFGLRAIKSVLTCAGAIRREKATDITTGKDKERDREAEQEEQNQETLILMRAIRDMNLPKFVQDDIYLFNALFNDLFTNMDLQDTNNVQFQETIENEMRLQGLIPKPEMVNKVVQLFDTKNTRHGNMLVGQALCGKSTCWKILKNTLNTLHKVDAKKYPYVKHEVLNPKSVSLNELFGWVDLSTMEWSDGVLSTMMSRLCKDESNDQRWMILDGPVDTLWIESMNTVLDDNKVLTLLSGDRISLPPQVGMIFEVEDLSVASPATVSRAGMVYIDPSDLGWRPYIESWIGKIKDVTIQEFFFDLVEKWILKLFKARQSCVDLVKCLDINIVISLCNLMNSFIKCESSYISLDLQEKSEIFWALLEKWWCFALIWSFGASVNEEGRKTIDYYVRDIESMFPHANTVYDYFISNEKNEWHSFEDKINAGNWKPPNNCPYHKMQVPTVDSQRNKFVITTLIRCKVNTLVVGNTGTGKTAVINNILQELDDVYSTMNIVFSARSGAQQTQEQIESKLKPRSKTKMIPDGKKMVIFIDDLNMPRKDTFGSQPALELLRQWIDYEGWFDRTFRDIFKNILDIQLITCMGPPSGGRAEISRRVQSKFNMINFTQPHDNQIKRIFQSILTFKFQEFDEDIKPLAEYLALATINLFKNVQDGFLPTPAKSHYLFNMRDISKVIQGVYLLDRFYCDSKDTVFRLWVHECLRVFHDRLINFEDRAQLKKLVGDQLEQVLGTDMRKCTNDEEEDTIFIDFMEENSGKNIYNEVPYKDRKEMKIFVEEQLAQYNAKQRTPMPIVLFQEAISYVCKINRIIKLGKGHGMLVGEGGSGRHSLSKLAAFIANYELWEIEIAKNYGMKQFKENIKGWCETAGQKNRPGIFLFSDNQIINEGFIENINNILTVGEVPNLFSPKDDYAIIRDKDARVADDELIDFFFTRVQTNFHVIICMSKTGDSLRNYTRMYPGLVNNTTIIWYLPWPEDALMEVANKYLGDIQLLKKVEIKIETKKTTAEEEKELEGKTEEENKVIVEKQQAQQKEQQEVKKEEEEEITEENLRYSISVFFSNCHQRVMELSDKMYKDLKRVYYVTPTNYIELVKGYCEMVKTKQDEFGAEIRKLSVGLHKLDEAAIDSEQLKAQLQVNSYVLSKKQKECEDLMIRIESEQREANEKQKEVELRQAFVGKEQAEIKIIAADADADLQNAMPALEMANEGLKNLDKQKLAEIKAYNKPPTGIDIVCYAIMIILCKEPTWASAKKELAQPDFLSKMQSVDKDHIPQKTLLRIEKMTSDPNMSPQKIDSISQAGGCLWKWVIAIEQYAKAFKDIEPKRAKVNLLKEKLRKSEEELHQLFENFNKLQETIKELQNKLVLTQKEQEEFKEQTKNLSEKQDRAEKLITGLEGTKEGWAVRKQGSQIKYEYLIGDTLMSAAFMSYAGPFPSQYRRAFVKDTCLGQVKALRIAHSKDYSFADFLVKQIEFLNWNFKGLPDDQFSKENAVLVTKSSRFPLMIDPQMQANIWIKNMERDRIKNQDKSEKKINLQIIDPQTDNYMKVIEQSIAWGEVVIFQNLDEDIDPSLEPILNKSLQKAAGGFLLTLSADRQIKYDPRFRFYMMTKLPNPKYKPEVSTRVTLVNFTVKEEGLEEQLISEVIKKIEAQLEKSKNELVRKKADNEQKLTDLDDKILRMLQESSGQLVDDLDLIKALQSAKETEEEVRHQMETSATQMRKTQAARNNYISLARTASKLFFVINEFSTVNNMYQFALDSYIQLFGRVIDAYQSKATAVNDSLADKLNAISENHKLEVYKYACRGLFENDKLLLSIQMAVRLSADIDQDEWNFFLRGGDLLTDRKSQPPNPLPDWISQPSWDSICDLDKMTSFAGIVGAFTHNGKEWRRWYMSSNPETDLLPSDWEQKFNPLSKMIMIKTIRPDRILFSASLFVENKIGEKFVSPSSFKFEELYESSTKITPVIFILSPGTDPFAVIQTFANQKGVQLVPVSLGQGQQKKAKESVTKGSQEGFWLYLANCHLSLSFLKELEKVIETLEIQKSQVNDNFRLWLSSAPHPKFPISILQKCVKQTSEPPKGVRANMTRMYQGMPAVKFSEGREMDNMNNKEWYKKLLFSLTWFHSIIIERKRFKNLGWNVVYDFNDADWETADNIIKIYVDEQSAPDKNQIQQSDAPVVRSPPWDAIRFLISEVTYGGRVTDDWDRRLLNVYAIEYFNDKIILEEKHKLAGDIADPKYVIPEQISAKELRNIDQKIGSEPNYYAMKIQDFPAVERPEVFGQHINAEISSQIIQSTALIDSILLLSPKTGEGQGNSGKEDIVTQILHDLYNKIPEEFNMEEIASKFNLAEETNPLKVVLLQEITRYQILLKKVRQSLVNLSKGLQGLVLISEELESILNSLFDNKVPEAWKFCYYSLKPLAAWTDDLAERVGQLSNWVFKGQPNIFTISYFSFPTGFTTALLQQSARKLRVPIDQFGWDFSFFPYDTPLQAPAKEGAYVDGLYIEGAKWDGEKSYIVEADPMKLHYKMPIIWFKPLFNEGRQKQKKAAMNYACPTYYYPFRTGIRDKPSYMLTVLLPIKPNPSAVGTSDQDFWVKRGTALLMSLAD